LVKIDLSLTDCWDFQYGLNRGTRDKLSISLRCYNVQYNKNLLVTYGDPIKFRNENEVFNANSNPLMAKIIDINCQVIYTVIEKSAILGEFGNWKQNYIASQCFARLIWGDAD
jgi:hypothetical protein